MAQVKQLPFQTIGICGGGKMGLSFFNHISPFNCPIVFYMRNSEKLARVRNSFLKRPGPEIYPGSALPTSLKPCQGPTLSLNLFRKTWRKKRRCSGSWRR